MNCLIYWMRISIIVMVFCTYTSSVTAYQYIDQHGCTKGVLADIIKLLKIDLLHYGDKNYQKSTLPSNHISYALNFLRLFYPDGSFQDQKEFYRHGGRPDYELSKDQALQILRIISGQFALFKPQDPIEKKKADVIICSGTDWALEKRVSSFDKFLAAGYDCDNVFLLSRTLQHDQNVKCAVERHETLFRGKKVHFLIVPYAKDSVSHENLSEALKPLVSKEFYLISDPEYADILLEAFTEYGKKYGLTCLGVFVRPISTDLDEYIRKDIVGYKLNEYISCEENQIIAAAYMSLCQLKYQVMEEIKLYEEKLMLLEKYNQIEKQYPSFIDVNDYGLCLRASAALPAQTIVATADFEPTKCAYIAGHALEEHKYVALMDVTREGKPEWGRVRGKWAFCNHSCDPNCDITDSWQIITNRMVSKGEELTTAYDALVYDFPWQDNWNFICQCKKPCCKKVINCYRYDIIYPIRRRK